MELSNLHCVCEWAAGIGKGSQCGGVLYPVTQACHATYCPTGQLQRSPEHPQTQHTLNVGKCDGGVWRKVIVGHLL